MARPTFKKQYLIDKYKELVWALSSQDYTGSDISVIMNRDCSVIKRIIDSKPFNYKTKWVKVGDNKLTPQSQPRAQRADGKDTGKR